MTMDNVPHRAVVVGVDGSAGSDLAVDWAVTEAGRKRLPLHLIHSLTWEYPLISAGTAASSQGAQEAGEKVCRSALDRALSADAGLSVTWHLSKYTPGDSLVSASRTADTVVVGARGLGAFRGLVLGSVSSQVAAHAHCPSVIVRDTASARSPVVVGVDGSAASSDAVAFAFEQAAATAVPVRIVHVWWYEYVNSGVVADDVQAEWPDLVAEERALIDAAIGRWRQTYPQVEVHVVSIHGHPVEILVRESQSSSLVVVGSRGRGGFRGLLLGSVSQGVLHAAGCSVAIVHSADPGVPWRTAP